MSNAEKPAAIYARGNTAEQIVQCHAYAKEHGYSVDEHNIYNDGFTRSGISDPHDSVAIALLLDAAKQGKFTTVLVPNLARISRSQVDLAQLLSELQSFRVEVIAVQGR